MGICDSSKKGDNVSKSPIDNPTLFSSYSFNRNKIEENNKLNYNSNNNFPILFMKRNNNMNRMNDEMSINSYNNMNMMANMNKLNDDMSINSYNNMNNIYMIGNMNRMNDYMSSNSYNNMNWMNDKMSINSYNNMNKMNDDMNSNTYNNMNDMNMMGNMNRINDDISSNSYNNMNMMGNMNTMNDNISFNINNNMNNMNMVGNMNTMNDNISFNSNNNMNYMNLMGNMNTMNDNISFNSNNNMNYMNMMPCNCPFCSKNNNIYVKTAKLFLVNDCQIPLSMLDEKGDCTSGWRENSQNGPPGYLKNYIPPKGWTAIGINVWNKYDFGNNDWLGINNNNGEWYIGYHGIKKKEAILGILTNGFIIGPGQTYKDSYNNNLLTKYNYLLCEEGAYFTPDINEANKYTDIIKYNNYDLRVVFMCRINPHKVRITNTLKNKEYWLTNGKTDEVRPYRILFHFEK